MGLQLRNVRERREEVWADCAAADGWQMRGCGWEGQAMARGSRDGGGSSEAECMGSLWVTRGGTAWDWCYP